MPVNTQPPEKLDRRDNGDLVVHSVFHTIQGEGPHAGRPAVFVRLSGCNLQCPACDTEYTSVRTVMTPSQLKDRVYDCALAGEPTLIVITGGEPFRQNIAPFAALAIMYGWDVQVETNGSLPPPLGLDPMVCVVVSPKTGSVHPQTASIAAAYKYVLTAGDEGPDGLPLHALDHPAAPRLARPPLHIRRVSTYLQPVDDGTDTLRHRAAVVDSCLAHGYRLCLQQHKIIGVD